MQKANAQNPVEQSKIWLIVILAVTLLLAIFIWKYFEFKIEKVKQNSNYKLLMVNGKFKMNASNPNPNS